MAVPELGPTTLYLSGSDKQSIVAGKMNLITLTGESLNNKFEDVDLLTASDEKK